MILHLTKKLADKLNLTTLPADASDAFYSWRANYIQEHGQRFVVFMNDASRFTIVINEAKTAKLKKLSELFIQTLRETLLAVGVNPEVVNQYVSELGKIEYAKNADRKKTAQLNKNTETAWWALRDFTDDVELSVCTNNALYNTSGTDEILVPKAKMLELLGRYGLPVRKFLALDLNVRLDLDGNDAIRKLRVPASITFEQLHKILQTAFNWKNCHLYSFGLFEKWSENYYATPNVELLVESDQYDAYEANRDAKPLAGVRLADYVPEYTKILYCYDFGDDWRHYVEIETIIDDCEEELPILLYGKGDSPPEDVGGAGGFAEFLETISDPEHEEYERLTEWAKSQWWKPFDFEITARQVKGGF
jgi:hypothetical protein